MAPSCPLPLPKGFSCAEDYVNSLLAFSTSSDTFQTLCGGVHILDFMTRDPDLYSVVLPEAWRTWFCEHKIEDILDLLMREDLTQFEETGDSYENGLEVQEQSYTWRGGSRPPSSLLMYVRDIRRHSLDRTFRKAEPSSIAQGKKGSGLARNVAVGMKPKKVHEVQNFAQYVDHLTIDIGTRSGHKITHLVDFGSGQNYLGRVLASQPYNKHIVAIESKDLNIDGARGMDITAKLTKKENAMRNKKQFRLDEKMPKSSLNSENVSSEPSIPATSLELGREIERRKVDYAVKYTGSGDGTIQYVKHEILDGKLPPVVRHIVNGPNRDIIPSPANGTPNNLRHNVQRHQSDSTFAPSKSTESKLHIVADAVLGSVESVFIGPLNLQLRDTATPGLLVISLHSCGNLLHHGIRSLLLNPLVRGVALIGCCYNLVTERLGPPSLKLPTLRPANARLGRTSSAQDPHGFPMSERLATYSHRHGRGLRLNITARMMAVQAPQNWTSTESEAFFTRHFFRALLQRIFLDRGVVGKPTTAESDVFAGSPAGWSGGTQPIIIGSLRKACYTSFVAYVRGAVAKLIADPEYGISIEEHMAGLMDTEIEKYERTYHAKKKELSIVWSLMAFSAGVVESVIVVDRWLFLKEHEHIVKDCWVEAVFDYKISPRNLAVRCPRRQTVISPQSPKARLSRPSSSVLASHFCAKLVAMNNQQLIATTSGEPPDPGSPLDM
ncbi:MAG: hypothetical protein M1835_008096 [Candelina submexicana]|nr:MAG: hypothetical protein M1835_008096 [Candelina submexicana]